MLTHTLLPDMAATRSQKSVGCLSTQDTAHSHQFERLASRFGHMIPINGVPVTRKVSLFRC